MSKAHDTAERNGALAFKAGLTRNACPYHDVRNDRGMITGSRGFRKAWLRGYDDAQREYTEHAKRVRSKMETDTDATDD